MGIDLELPIEMMEKLKSAARTHGGSTSSFVVLAIAEKLARMEHEQWLAKMPQPDAAPKPGKTGAASDDSQQPGPADTD